MGAGAETDAGAGVGVGVGTPADARAGARTDLCRGVGGATGRRRVATRAAGALGGAVAAWTGAVARVASTRGVR